VCYLLSTVQSQDIDFYSQRSTPDDDHAPQLHNWHTLASTGVGSTQHGLEPPPYLTRSIEMQLPPGTAPDDVLVSYQQNLLFLKCFFFNILEAISAMCRCCCVGLLLLLLLVPLLVIRYLC
jgi:hypothetical protein